MRLAGLRCAFALYSTPKDVERINPALVSLYGWMVKIVASVSPAKTELNLAVAALGVSMVTKQVENLGAIVKQMKEATAA